MTSSDQKEAIAEIVEQRNKDDNIYFQNTVDPYENAICVGRKRHEYSIEFKLNAIAKWRELNGDTSQAAKHPEINVNQQTLKLWISNEERYRSVSNQKMVKRIGKKTRQNNAIIKYGELKKNSVPFVNPNLTSSFHSGLSNQDFSSKHGSIRRTRNAFSTVSPVNFLKQQNSLSQPTAAKFSRLTERPFENPHFENRQANPMSHPMQSIPSVQVQRQQHLQVAPQVSVPVQPSLRKMRGVLEASVQETVAKPKPAEKPRPRDKKLVAVANHQHFIMSNLASLWRNGKLCDAGISNGFATVKVHKLVLFAVCPKLLSVFNEEILSQEFFKVNFPQEVSKDALNAFAEYMYKGVLDLDPEILEQLKIIANKLNMEEFEQLCDGHLLNYLHKPDLLSSSVPSIPSTLPIPDTTPSLASSIRPSIYKESPKPLTPPVVDIKQEITEAELDKVLKETAAVFGLDSKLASLVTEEAENAAAIENPSIKMEVVGPEIHKYGHLNQKVGNQTFTTTTSSSSSSLPPAAAAASTSTTSISQSPKICTNPFAEEGDNPENSVKLKTLSSFEDPLTSDLSSAPIVIPPGTPQLNSINNNSSEALTRPSSTLSPIDMFLTSNNSNNSVYPVKLFSAMGDNLPL